MTGMLSVPSAKPETNLIVLKLSLHADPEPPRYEVVVGCTARFEINSLVLRNTPSRALDTLSPRAFPNI